MTYRTGMHRQAWLGLCKYARGLSICEIIYRERFSDSTKWLVFVCSVENIGQACICSVICILHVVTLQV